eukprot:scaffold32931_cov62-Phaeocystis_antarctica.AAC.7
MVLLLAASSGGGDARARRALARGRLREKGRGRSRCRSTIRHALAARGGFARLRGHILMKSNAPHRPPGIK